MFALFFFCESFDRTCAHGQTLSQHRLIYAVGEFHACSSADKRKISLINGSEIRFCSGTCCFPVLSASPVNKLTAKSRTIDEKV